jgi:hypothetical protein
MCLLHCAEEWRWVLIKEELLPEVTRPPYGHVFYYGELGRKKAVQNEKANWLDYGKRRSFRAAHAQP